MGVYINMEMPTSCGECPMCYDMMQCSIAEPIINFFKVKVKEFDFCTERNPRCPLVPVPPHGDLIDRGALEKAVFDGRYQKVFLHDCPTIIPADKEAGE